MKCNAWPVYIFNVSSTKKKRIYLIYLKHSEYVLRKQSDKSDKSASLIIFTVNLSIKQFILLLCHQLYLCRFHSFTFCCYGDL